MKAMTGTPMVLAWAIAVGAGMTGMLRYQMTASIEAQIVPGKWPDDASIQRDSHRATLVMMLHPQCPCSRASLHELGELMARADGRLDAQVLFIEPANAPADWLNGDLWNQAKAIPNVAVSIDKDGKDAAAFGATTSGQVAVYDASGTMRFKGGITAGRGHEGDNAGYLAILSLIRDGSTQVVATPVYGCSLQTPKADAK